MDLTITYAGLKLASPLIVGASPMANQLDLLRQLEDAGAAAIVMNSLFEEQVVGEDIATVRALENHADVSAEAQGFLSMPPHFNTGPEEYLKQLQRIKQAVDVPVFGSLNGVTPGGWLKYAVLMQQAGADAIELNTYNLVTDPDVDADAVECRLIEVVRQIKTATRIPLAVKLSPFYTALPNLARRLAEAGADALVLFNRFYQPDINVEDLRVVRVHLSDSSELLLRLHWLAILSGQTKISLAASGGVHTALDAIKALMTGADAVQLVSSLLRHGPEHLRTVRRHMIGWMEDYEYESLAQMQGSMNLTRCPDPQAYQRANYIQLLQTWRE